MKLRITVENTSYDVEVEFLDGSKAPAPAAAAPSAQSAAIAAAPASSSGGCEVTSPLAAVVVSIDIAMGATVTEGQQLLTLEAMKMNTLVSAPQAGTVTAIHAAAGDAVAEGAPLISIN